MVAMAEVNQTADLTVVGFSDDHENAFSSHASIAGHRLELFGPQQVAAAFGSSIAGRHAAYAIAINPR